jgi:hypothetical protein
LEVIKLGKLKFYHNLILRPKYKSETIGEIDERKCHSLKQGEK